MGGFQPAVDDAAGALFNIFKTIGWALVEIGRWLGNAISLLTQELIEIIIPEVVESSAGTTWLFGSVWSSIRDLARWTINRLGYLYHRIRYKLEHIYGAFKRILEIIHFKTILRIHQILMLVSPQYRNMMKNVFFAINRASEALGMGTTFLILAIQNTRNLVLDVSSTMGKGYDLSQVEWLGTLNKWLNYFQDHAETYKNNPEQVFWDLAKLIEQPAIDSKGGFQSTLIANVDTVIDTVLLITDGFGKIGIDIETLYDDLPQFIKNVIPDPGSVFWTNLDGWYHGSLVPSLDVLSKNIKDWATDYAAAKSDVSDLVEDLRRPGTMMARVDSLGPVERVAQEDLIGEISSRRLNRLLTDLQPTFSFAGDKMEANARIPIPPPSVLPILSYELATASVPSPGAMVPRRTWFVGDF